MSFILLEHFNGCVDFCGDTGVNIKSIELNGLSQATRAV